MTARRFLIALVILVMMAGSGAAGLGRAATVDDDAITIRQVMDQQQAAWNRGDVADYMRGYKDAPDTTFIGSSVRKGYRAILDSYRKHYATKQQMGRLTFSDLDVRLLPDASGEVRYAAVTGRFHLDRTTHGEAAKDDGVFSLLWEKTAEGWKIILDHSS
ncbi:MAG TPA: nuclear transport factor 2 family protein [Rhodanobacter sp.]|jgi:uncharacterized protein (TIGR02246 family)|nr:nuclear transport factor 2 family protein [Rhodanobacter sp.]